MKSMSQSRRPPRIIDPLERVFWEQFRNQPHFGSNNDAVVRTRIAEVLNKIRSDNAIMHSMQFNTQLQRFALAALLKYVYEPFREHIARDPCLSQPGRDGAFGSDLEWTFLHSYLMEHGFDVSHVVNYLDPATFQANCQRQAWLMHAHT